MGIELFLIITALFLVFVYNVIYYIPHKLKEQEEKQSLYVKELYIRINKLESKIDKLIDSNQWWDYLTIKFRLEKSDD